MVVARTLSSLLFPELPSHKLYIVSLIDFTPAEIATSLISASSCRRYEMIAIVLHNNLRFTLLQVFAEVRVFLGELNTKYGFFFPLCSEAAL